MNKWIVPILIFVAIGWFLTGSLGPQILTIATVVTFVFVLTLLSKLNIFKALPVKGQTETILLVASGIALFAMGTFGAIGLTPEALGLGGMFAPITGMLTGQAVAVPGTTPGTAACVVPNPAIVGKSATLNLVGPDQAANSPDTSAIGVSGYVIDSDGTITAISGASFTGVNVGDVISIYGGNTTQYQDPVTDVCITGETQTIEVPAYTIDAETDLVTACFDQDDTALSGGTNTSEEDYDITMGADQDKQFSCRLTVNSANAAFNLGGIAVATVNDAKDLVINEVGFSEIPEPAWLSVMQMSADDGNQADNYTGGYDFVLKKDTPLMLTEWDDVKYSFTVSSSSTDPTTSTDFSASDMIVMCWLDAVYDRGDDGQIYLDVFKHDSSESNVGMTETYNLPVDKDSCVVIELI